MVTTVFTPTCTGLATMNCRRSRAWPQKLRPSGATKTRRSRRDEPHRLLDAPHRAGRTSPIGLRLSFLSWSSSAGRRTPSPRGGTVAVRDGRVAARSPERARVFIVRPTRRRIGLGACARRPGRVHRPPADGAARRGPATSWTKLSTAEAEEVAPPRSSSSARRRRHRAPASVRRAPTRRAGLGSTRRPPSRRRSRRSRARRRRRSPVGRSSPYSSERRVERLRTGKAG